MRLGTAITKCEKLMPRHFDKLVLVLAPQPIHHANKLRSTLNQPRVLTSAAAEAKKRHFLSKKIGERTASYLVCPVPALPSSKRTPNGFNKK
jgi:hypothetical protein